MIERVYYRVKLNTDQIIYSQPIDIVQDTGTSTTKVMSQNAVTTAINTILESGGAELEAKLNENIVKDPSKTYLVWKGDKFPNSTNATFKAPASCVIDWGDGVVETFETASTEVNTHTYTDGIEYHLISLSNYIIIGNSAFEYCRGLTSVTIGNGVTSIGDSAFFSCSGLTSVTIPNSVTSIGSQVFYNCIGLTSVTIPNSVTSIGNSAFYDCRGLTSVIWNAENCTSAGSSSYPIFSGCSKLTNVTIGENVKTIPNYAFYGCTVLTSVTIGNNVTFIGDYAFYDCRKLTSIIIPDSVTSIGGRAFYGYTGLRTIRILAINPPTLYSDAFYTSVEKIIVPKLVIDAYKNVAGWSDYADKIVYEVDSSDLIIDILTQEQVDLLF